MATMMGEEEEEEVFFFSGGAAGVNGPGMKTQISFFFLLLPWQLRCDIPGQDR